MTDEAGKLADKLAGDALASVGAGEVDLGAVIAALFAAGAMLIAGLPPAARAPMIARMTRHLPKHVERWGVQLDRMAAAVGPAGRG